MQLPPARAPPRPFQTVWKRHEGGEHDGTRETEEARGGGDVALVAQAGRRAQYRLWGRRARGVGLSGGEGGNAGDAGGYARGGSRVVRELRASTRHPRPIGLQRRPGRRYPSRSPAPRPQGGAYGETDSRGHLRGGANLLL